MLASLNTVASGTAVGSGASSCSFGCRSGDAAAVSSFGVFNAHSVFKPLALGLSGHHLGRGHWLPPWNDPKRRALGQWCCWTFLGGVIQTTFKF